ncbi:MAG: hypothetical protein PHP70_06610 [Gallionella sp.]|nr:hypothetical protein [Gallionella sp.]
MGSAAERKPLDLLGIVLLGGYLVFELAFNARLLDLSGGMPTEEDLRGIEIFGRTISGVGLGLFVWGFAQRATQKRWLSAAVCIALCIPVAFVAQEWIVNRLVSGASPAKRQLATYLSLVSRATLMHAVTIDGLNLSGKDFDTPAGKTFVALFPVTGFASDATLAKLKQALPTLVQSMAASEMGEPEEVFNDVYVPFANQWRKIYNEKYLPASEAAGMANGGADGVDRAWNDYLNELDIKNINASSASEFVRREVVERLQKTGVPVENDWRLNDYEGFAVALRNKSAGSGDRFRKDVSDAIGFDSDLPPGLSWDGFSIHPDILRKAKAELQLRIPGAEIGESFGLNLSLADFTRNFYKHNVEKATAEKLAQFSGDSGRFSSGGDASDIADKAMKAVIVPPVALGFSLAFGFLNALNLLAKVARLQGNIVLAAKAAATALLICVPLAVGNTVSDSPVFASLSRNVAENYGQVPAVGLRWLVNSEPMFYPVSNALRRHLLRDFRFSL